MSHRDLPDTEPANNRDRYGVTLVELLVALAIAAALAAITLPAVQYARESARRTQCASHLRQIAIACLTHEGAQGHLPTGGWGWGWHGDPDRGFGKAQPGGWAFNVLPFLEQGSLHDLGAGHEPATKRSLGRQVAETPLQVFACPSRRTSQGRPFVHPTDFINIDRPSVVGRSDYAGNMGHSAVELFRKGPSSLAEGDSPSYAWPGETFSGVIFRRSQVRLAEILDGASQTFLVGEAYLNPDHYATGRGQNDDQSMYVGFDRDTLRTTDFDFAPLADTRGIDNELAFGSAHAGVMHMSFCDGSVRPIRYSVDAWSFLRYGSRDDGQPIQE